LLCRFLFFCIGTVCIGTFGLRGAVGNDNAGSAIEASKQIIKSLSALNLTCSVGVTTGKAYCGFVGSPARNEFAIMGPSTNLSARLMSKTPPNNITCDADTKQSDRSHSFEPLNEITAKGYTKPVKTYRPIHENSANRSAISLVHQFSLLTHSSQKYTPAINKLQKEKSKAALLNRGLIAATGGGGGMIGMISETGFVNKDGNNNNEVIEFQGNIKLKEMIEFDGFFTSISSEIHKINGHSLMSRQIKLYGRQNSIINILTGLFPTLDSEKKDSTLKTTTIFDITSLTSFVACCGIGGSGKSAILNSIGSKFYQLAKNNSIQFNILVIQNRANSVQLKDPFNGWRTLLSELLKNCVVSSNHYRRSMRISAYEDFPPVIDELFEKMKYKGKYEKNYLLKILGLETFTEYDDASRTQLQSVTSILVDFINAIVKKLNKFVLFIM
jgi:hypothetical protein